MKRIPDPPSAFVEMKCTLFGIWDPSEKELAYKRFKSSFKDRMSEVGKYISTLEEIRNFNWAYATFSVAKSVFNYQGEGIDPLEYIELDEMSAKYYKAKRKWGLIYDLDYERVDGRLRQIKTFAILHPESLYKKSELPGQEG